MSIIIKRDTTCGIFDTTFRAEVADDKIKLTSPYIKWVDNSGNLAFERSYIRDPAIVAAANKALAEDDYPAADQYGDAYDDAEDFVFRLLLNFANAPSVCRQCGSTARVGIYP